MSLVSSMNRRSASELQRLLEANPLIDWRTLVLDRSESLAAMRWAESDPVSLKPLLMGYQRLVRILPHGEERRALALLESGLHSAIQIASLSRDEFACRWEALFPGEGSLGLAVHDAAIRRRGELVLHHINNVQHNEPHYRAARFK